MATVYGLCLFCCAEENIMLKNKRIVVLMVVIGVLNLPVCAWSYEYVTLSPNSNDANNIQENIGNSSSNRTLESFVEKRASFIVEKPNKEMVPPEKYLSYSTRIDDFSNKRLKKKYSKAIINIKNISDKPLKLEWSQTNNDISSNTAYNNTLYIATIGSQWVAFIGGATIIGTPFAIYAATEMVKNKNAELLNEINSYSKAGVVNWNAILQPNESMNLHFIKSKTQVEPVTFKSRFTGDNDKFYTELNVNL